MQNFLHVKKYIFCKIKSLYTINNLCVVIDIIANFHPYGLKIMSRNTLSEPQPDSASDGSVFSWRELSASYFAAETRPGDLVVPDPFGR